jgi:hypothetical protein
MKGVESLMRTLAISRVITQGRLAGVVLTVFVGACAGPLSSPGGQGSRQVLRLQLPPAEAAACFARNAEEHSSALKAEVRTGPDRAEVIVRVKNGVLYGTANFRRAGTGSSGDITLNVATTGRRGDLIEALTEGC